MASFLLFVTGLAVLIYAAELVVRGGSQLALSLGIRPLILGITVVAIGTSTPELAVGLTAASSGSGGIAVGNIAGTNMVNLLLILGLSALIRPLPLHLQTLKLDLPMMLVATLLMTALAWDGLLSRMDGAIMLTVAIIYTYALLRISRRESQRVRQEFREEYGADAIAKQLSQAENRSIQLGILLAGIALSVLGAHWLVSGAVDLARSFGWSESIIGLTIVAIGTSAPELVTTMYGTWKNERDVAIGNLMGSSIYNILAILGFICLIPSQSIVVERDLLTFDIPLLAGLMLICIPVFVSGSRISRPEGGIFVCLYLGYLSWLLLIRT